MKIQIKQPMVVSEIEVTVPCYYQFDRGYYMCYGCISADLHRVEMQVRKDGSLFMIDVSKLETYMLESAIASRAEMDKFTLIEEAVFSHHFAMHHRELFYKIFPDARPSI